MAEVVGIRFKRAGRIYFFDPAGLDLKVKDWVVVRTERGLELGYVVIAPKQVLKSELKEPLKPIERKASPEDLAQTEEFKSRQGEVLAKTAEKVAKLGLPMKLLGSEYTLDGSYLTINFSAGGRIDFRELVKEMAATFKVRVELHQVNPREEAKLLGGIGRCGRPVCCSCYLTAFAPVSIRMAKEQELPINQAQLAGLCGRLRCCLRNENDFYSYIRKTMPQIGQKVGTPKGTAIVMARNLLKELVTVRLEDTGEPSWRDEILDLPLGQLSGFGDVAPCPIIAAKKATALEEPAEDEDNTAEAQLLN